MLVPPPPQRVLRTQKSMTHLLRTETSKVLLLQPRVGQNIVMHASLSASDFFLELASTFPFHSLSLFCPPKPLPSFFFLCWLQLMQVPVSACRISQVTLFVIIDSARSSVECPRNINRFQNIFFIVHYYNAAIFVSLQRFIAPKKPSCIISSTAFFPPLYHVVRLSATILKSSQTCQTHVACFNPR